MEWQQATPKGVGLSGQQEINAASSVDSSKLLGKLDEAIAAIRDPRDEWTRTAPGLEDVFISLMGGARDNFS